MQSGFKGTMGPGGAAAATALYSLAGLGAYLFVGAMLVVSTRCFRGIGLHGGAREIGGGLGLLFSLAVLLHLPFADHTVDLRGPGGLLGQWLGEIAASFIGVAGAALAAATLLSVSLLLLTNVRVREVVAAIAWAGRQLGRGVLWSLGRIGRLVMAMFPEKTANEEASARAAIEDQEFLEEAEDNNEIPVVVERSPPVVARMEPELSDAIRVGQEQAIREEIDPGLMAAVAEDATGDDWDDGIQDIERRAMADVVAEVAAVECAAVAHAETEAKAAAQQSALPALIIAADPEADDALGIPPIPELPKIPQLAAQVAVPPPAPPLAAKPAEAAPIIVEPLARPEPPAKPTQGPGFIRLSAGDFKLPGTDLLDYVAPPEGNQLDRNALYDMAENVERAMGNYGVKGKVKEIMMGPVVTMYEFAPAPGTRTGKIANLENDMAMALEAQAVRIVAPIPGKASVGVEVPNKNRETVYLKEILEDESFRRAASKLQVSLGKDTKGAPVSVNLAKMPHLLVAGTTGSGKSVAVNSMITSILYSASPEDVRFIMVDPKMLELSIYEGIPHLLLPVVTDPKKANLALRWAVDEMERRYELLSKVGVRDIASYNARIEQEQNRAKSNGVVAGALQESPSGKARRLKVVIAGPDGVEREVEVEEEGGEYLATATADPGASRATSSPDAAPPRKLPLIVIVIDEFADLMMVAPKDVETSVARLAQKARAAGLHLILATQRPSVDVLTGLIRANFPSRIALQVATKTDSRVILDQNGAETLLGNGDMLFSDRGTKLKRIHGSFLSDREVQRVVDFLKVQAKPVYDMDILKPREEEGADGEGAPVDEMRDQLYDQAVAIVCETRQASVSFIQRRLQIGYNRSARMVEQMERDGIVGPANGIKPREVIAPAGEYLTAAV